ncbi:unnamed protein product [Calicophoron daubneyi]|uniref:Uncharacterized protein n=1 Tax=Calicophoron daubneyi TaxID=300641 RepID=A0AAV2TFB5_CALDB
MIKEVSYEPSFIDRFKGFVGFRYGVLLSGPMDNEECLFLPIEVPVSDESDVSARHKPESLGDIEERWIAAHCRNLNRMMPGGVRVSGLCAASSLTDFTAFEDHIRKVLCSMPKDESILGELSSPRDSEKLMLLVDPATRKVCCKVLDTSSNDRPFRTVNVRTRPLLNYWRAFKTHISLQLETNLPSDRKKEKILRQLQAAVEPYLRALVTETNLLVNGEMRDDAASVFVGATDFNATTRSTSERATRKSKRQTSPPVEVAHPGDYVDTKGDGDDKKTKRGRRQKSLKDMDAEKGVWADVDLNIFGPQFPRWQRASSSSSLESGTSSDAGTNDGTETTESSPNEFVPVNRLVVNGRIPGIAYLPMNATVGSLLQALRKDLVQSVLARLQLLTEELHITSAELEVPRMLLPQRVLVRLPACPSLPLSDYKFLSETADDVVARLHYFCVPIGSQGAGDVIDDPVGRPSSAESCNTSTTSTAATSSNAQAFTLLDRIDASCLDTSLEQSPEEVYHRVVLIHCLRCPTD